MVILVHVHVVMDRICRRWRVRQSPYGVQNFTRSTVT